MAEREEELKSLVMKVKEENEKAGLKLNIQKAKIMASSPITSWQIERETVTDIIFLGSKITADSDCSHKIKRYLFLGRKAMTNLDGVLKSRDITLLTKDMRLTKLQEIVKDREAWHAAVHGVAKSQTRLSDSTTTTRGHPYAVRSVLIKDFQRQSSIPG